MTKRKVYIFRGAPASGKGTIVPMFCKLLPLPIALIEQDKFRWGIHTFGRKKLDISDEEHFLAHRATVATYKEYLGSLHTVVIEGLFTWNDQKCSQGSAKELIDAAQNRGYEVKSIVLRADKQQLLKRNAERSYSVPRAEFETLYRNVYAKIGPNEIVCDSTALSIDETISSLKAQLLVD